MPEENPPYLSTERHTEITVRHGWMNHISLLKITVWQSAEKKSQLYTPSDLSSYGSDEYNNLTDPLDAAGMNHWTTIDLGTTILVARKIDPFKTYTVEDLDSMYDLLTSMKSDAIQDELYAAGAALDHNLNN